MAKPALLKLNLRRPLLPCLVRRIFKIAILSHILIPKHDTRRGLLWPSFTTFNLPVNSVVAPSARRSRPPQAAARVAQRGGVKGCVTPPRQDSVELIRFPCAFSQQLRETSSQDAFEPGDGDRARMALGSTISPPRYQACRHSHRGCGTSSPHPPRSSRCRWQVPREWWA